MTDSFDKCNSCNTYYLPPIYSCPRKHILCNNCTQDAQYMVTTSKYNLRQAKLKSVTKLKLFCGKCMNFYYIDEEIRNENVESSIRNLKYPCIYRMKGCQFEDVYPNIQNHNETCAFMVISCFVQNCYWTGYLSDMKDHLKYHCVIKIGSNQALVNNSCYVIFHDDSFYILKILLEESHVKFFVVYHGQPDKYQFEINIGSRLCAKYPIKIIKVISQMKTPKIHGFNSENADVFKVDFDFVEQFINVTKEKIHTEVQFMVNISQI